MHIWLGAFLRRTAVHANAVAALGTAPFYGGAHGAVPIENELNAAVRNKAM